MPGWSPCARTVIGGAAVAAVISVTTGASGATGFDLGHNTVPLERIISGGPAKDGIPALSHPAFVSAAAADYLRSEDRVVGIHNGTTAKAYPLRLLNWHEVVNDHLGKRPLVITYCPLTASAVVFDRKIDNEELSFGVSGLLYESNVLLYDHQTESLWSQLKGQGVTGPKSAVALTRVPAVETTWGWWRAEHPDTQVLSPQTGHLRDYGRNPYAAYDASPRTMFPTSRVDSRLEPKERVLGVMIDGISRAYPLRRLAALRGVVHERVGTVDLTVTYDPATMTSEVRAGNVPLAATVLYWFAWAAFHPETSVWDMPGPPATGSNRVNDVEISEVKSYWSTTVGILAEASAPSRRTPASFYVISGSLKNTSTRSIHHVELRFDLIDSKGEVVYREAGFNRSAEALRSSGAGKRANTTVEPIPPGGTDSFRMLLFADELPRFAEPRVAVTQVK